MFRIYFFIFVIVNVCFVVGLVFSLIVIVVFVVCLWYLCDDCYFILYLFVVDLFGLVMNMLGIWGLYIYSVSVNKDMGFVCKGFWYICLVFGCFFVFFLIGIVI